MKCIPLPAGPSFSIRTCGGECKGKVHVCALHALLIKPVYCVQYFRQAVGADILLRVGLVLVKHMENHRQIVVILFYGCISSCLSDFYFLLILVAGDATVTVTFLSLLSGLASICRVNVWFPEPLPGVTLHHCAVLDICHSTSLVTETVNVAPSPSTLLNDDSESSKQLVSLSSQPYTIKLAITATIKACIFMGLYIDFIQNVFYKDNVCQFV